MAFYLVRPYLVGKRGWIVLGKGLYGAYPMIRESGSKAFCLRWARRAPAEDALIVR